MSYFLAASLAKLRDEVNTRWPNRSKVSDGWIGDTAHQARKSDHNPDWTAPGNRRGVVRALDITTKGIDVDLLLKHTTNDSRVAYVIYNRRIYTHSRGWYRYTGSNPHTGHVHVSIRHTAKAETDLKPWIPGTPSSGGGGKPGMSKPIPAPSKPAKPSTRKIQQDLNRYAKAGLIVDGVNGPVTKAWVKWVKSAQRTHLPAWKGVPKLVVDGHYGPVVANAVKTIQRRNGLVVDGMLGPITIAFMRRHGSKIKNRPKNRP